MGFRKIYHRLVRKPAFDRGQPGRINKGFPALITFAECLLIVSAAWAGPEITKPIDSPLSTWLAADGITGEWDGMRLKLNDHGVVPFANYIAEVWANTVGGEKQGSVYTGLLNFGADIDLEKLIGWKGASIHNDWFWLSGRDASGDLVGNFLTISNIAGFDVLRMDELWFQQNLLNDSISIKVGQIRADTEFVISKNSALFINATLGFPAFLYTNLPDGGPVYPMGTPAIRLSFAPTPNFTLRSAVFAGNKFAQNVNRYGFRYSLDAGYGYFWITEAEIGWFRDKASTGLPGTFKVGTWFHSGRFTNPSDGENLDGNYGFYFIVDQMLYRQAGETASSSSGDKEGESASDSGLNWFGRLGFAPQTQNFVGFYLDTGFTYKGLIPSRSQDTIGLAFAYAQLTSPAQQSIGATGSIPAGNEMVVELTYQAQISKWMTIQPDLQYIINPGGTQNLRDAFVIGARATIAF